MSATDLRRYLFAGALAAALGLYVLYGLRAPDDAPPPAIAPPDINRSDVAVSSDARVTAPAVSTIPLDAPAVPNDAGEPDAFSCPEPPDPTALDFAAMAEALRYSDDPEHLLMASLYGGSERRSEFPPFPEKLDLDPLLAALEMQPKNELLLWHAMALCARSDEQGLCAERNVPELATATLGENMSFWFRLAAIRLDAGDTDGALAALQQSQVAPEYKEYFIEHVELFARGIAAFNNAPYNERIVAGFGLAAALQGAESDVLLACQRHAPTSPTWLSTCTSIGERMEGSGRTLLSEMLGLGLQQAMYKLAGDDQRVRWAAGREDYRRRFIEDMSVRGEQLAIMNYDERVLESYVDAWKSGGEEQAMTFLYAETRRLMQIPGYRPCADR